MVNKQINIGWLLVGVLFSGNTNNGDHAGFGYANTNNTPSNTNANIGSHLCFKIGFDNMKQYKRMTALPLGKRFQANLLKVLVGTPVVWATEDSE